jgi:hypothetical protein
MNLAAIPEIFDRMVVNYNQIDSNSVHSLNGYYRRLKFFLQFISIRTAVIVCNFISIHTVVYMERMVQQLNLLCELLINVQMAAEVVISFFLFFIFIFIFLFYVFILLFYDMAAEFFFFFFKLFFYGQSQCGQWGFLVNDLGWEKLQKNLV